MNKLTKSDLVCRSDKPQCPECEGLECVCRPRFFAGQRLTERELNDLIGYMKAKQRLHNRYLHGWGTVCGLEVSCDPCGNAVRVSPGYAVDPCGEDIVVCETDTVDVCKLIKQCCDQERRDLCRPYGATSECEGVEQKWILAIRYEETQSRGIIPLIARPGAKTSCGCGTTPCSCGGGKSCSCGGGASCSCGGKTKGTKVTPPRSAPPQCEPTQVCEVYRYEVYRLPDEPEDPQPNPDDQTRNLLLTVFCGLEGPMFERICCCLTPLFAVIPPNVPTLPATGPAQRQAAFQWCCRLKLNVLAYLDRHPSFDCAMAARLRALECPSPELADAAFNAAMTAVAWEMAIFLVEAMIACLCSAFLPQCPPPALEARVPLAVITVTGKNCKVLDVCNWTPHRKILLTWQTMSYWFSWLPLFKSIRNGLHALCCNLFGLKVPTPQPPGVAGVAPAVNPAGVAANVTNNAQPAVGPFLNSAMFFDAQPSFATAALMRMPRMPIAMSPADLAAALFRKRGPGDTVALSDDDIATVPEFRLLNHLAAPLVSSLGIDGLMAALGPGARDVPGAPGAKESDVVELRQQVKTLQATLKSQAVEIERLSDRIGRKE